MASDAESLRGSGVIGSAVSAAKAEQAEDVTLWRDPLLWFTLALTIFAIAPFMLPGYFWGANDARHHVYFLFEYDRLVQDGIWWPRWSPDFAFGYGYPFFNIYGLFSHFLAEVLHHFLGLGYTAAVEAVFALSIVGSAAGMYVYMRAWAGRQAAVVAALVYVYVPYHLLNLYVRGNLAESMALVWLPLCLWTVRQAIVRRSFGWMTGTAVCYAGLMLTSNLVIVLFTPLLGLYLLAVAWTHATEDVQPAAKPSVVERLWRWARSAAPAVAGLFLALGLSAIFWLPMVTERQYVRVDQWFDGRYDFHGNFVTFFQLFSPTWGFGISEAGPDDPLGFQLGAVALILATVGVLLAWRPARRLRLEIACFVLAAAVSAFVTLQAAAPIWDLPVVGTILGFAQFPWRWFSITSLCLSILAGLVMLPEVHGGPMRSAIVLLAVIGLVLAGSYPLLGVEITEPAEGPVGLAALMRFQQSSDEMTGSTAWVKEIPTWSPMADEYVSKEKAGEPVTPVTSMVDYTTLNYHRETGFVVNSEKRNSVMEEVWYWSPLEGRRITFNQFYYPGWRAYLLDEPGGEPVEELPIIPETEGTLGRMTVPVPVGEGYVLLRYEDTAPRIIGRWIAWATIGVLLIAGGVSFWRRRPAEGA